MLLIPSIDLRGGRCVRLLKGDFGTETGYAVEPLELLRRYRELGAPWLHVVDLDGAREGTLANGPTIAALATQQGVALQTGGGVRTRAAAVELLRLGVDRIVVGSAAAESPVEVAEWLAEVGPERIAFTFDLPLDTQGVPLIQVRGWRQATALSLWRGVDRFGAAGLRHLLCTDIERDGALAGAKISLYPGGPAGSPESSRHGSRRAASPPRPPPPQKPRCGVR